MDDDDVEDDDGDEEDDEEEDDEDGNDVKNKNKNRKSDEMQDGFGKKLLSFVWLLNAFGDDVDCGGGDEEKK